jgi:hypothetical protein
MNSPCLQQRHDLRIDASTSPTCPMIDQLVALLPLVHGSLRARMKLPSLPVRPIARAAVLVSK